MSSLEKGETDAFDEKEIQYEKQSDVEPLLKYEKIANDVGSCLQNDQATCMAVHSKVNIFIE